MGVDIHMFAETIDTEKKCWSAIKAVHGDDFYLDYLETADTKAKADARREKYADSIKYDYNWIFEGRNSRFFGFLAGVRDNYQAFEVKGLPSDVSEEIKMLYNDEDYFSASYIYFDTIEEIHSNPGEWLRYFKYNEDDEDVDFDAYEAVIKCIESIYKTIVKNTSKIERKNLRIVFWFDC